MQATGGKKKRTGTAESTIKHKRKHGLCLWPFCGGKQGTKKKYCNKHHQREQKRKNLISYMFHIRKSNATKRQIEWGLTLAEFEKICIDNGLCNQKTIFKKRLSLDRKKADKGYFLDNIRVITVSENGRKGSYERKDRELPPEYQFNEPEEFTPPF